MKLNSRIVFIGNGEPILMMEQLEPRHIQPGDHNRQFTFVFYNTYGLEIGTMDPDLTKGCGYTRAIGHVGYVLMQLFPDLTLEITSYHSSSTPTFKWTTSEIRDAIQEMYRWSV